MATQTATITIPRTEVVNFSLAIEGRLAHRDADLGDSWKEMTSDDLVDYLRMRLRKLAAALLDGEDAEVRKQAASMGAAAMFAFDNYSED